MINTALQLTNNNRKEAAASLRVSVAELEKYMAELKGLGFTYAYYVIGYFSQLCSFGDIDSDVKLAGGVASFDLTLDDLPIDAVDKGM